jgi:hypothetical protein
VSLAEVLARVEPDELPSDPAFRNARRVLRIEGSGVVHVIDAEGEHLGWRMLPIGGSWRSADERESVRLRVQRGRRTKRARQQAREGDQPSASERGDDREAADQPKRSDAYAEG